MLDVAAAFPGVDEGRAQAAEIGVVTFMESGQETTEAEWNGTLGRWLTGR
jgi:hypothetical protein